MKRQLNFIKRDLLSIQLKILGLRIKIRVLTDHNAYNILESSLKFEGICKYSSPH